MSINGVLEDLALADVLQGGDERIYMRQRVFNAQLEPQKPRPPAARVFAKLQGLSSQGDRKKADADAENADEADDTETR